MELSDSPQHPHPLFRFEDVFRWNYFSPEVPTKVTTTNLKHLKS